MAKYKQPEAHHWIALRLMRGYVILANTHNRDCYLTIQWLLREVGFKKINHMLDQLKQEEAQ